MTLIVQKFGGTSVGDIEKIRRVARIVADTADAGHQVVTVVSAMGHTTDHLVAMAAELMPNPGGREYDALLATGEMVTTSLLAMALNQMGYNAVGLNGGQAGVITEDLFNRARILEVQTDKIQHHLGAGRIVIVTGFQGLDSQGSITTLGRGGSDTSAVALAGALNAARCDIYTDVTGVFSTDPRICPKAVQLKEIADIEMLELARVGAGVLHPRAVETARQAGVRLCVRSTFELDNPGTLILGVDTMEEHRSVAGIACDNNQARVALTRVPDEPGVAAEVFGALAQNNISVDMIIQSLFSETHPHSTDNRRVNDIAFTVSLNELHDAVGVLEAVRQKIGAEAVVSDDAVAKVSIVGAGMIDAPGIAAKMFRALADASVNIRMISTSEIKISCLVAKDQAEAAVKKLHHVFFETQGAVQKELVNERLGY